MTADTPPTHSDLSKMPGVIRYWSRGGHAVPPKRWRVEVRGGQFHGSEPIANPACRVTFSRLTPYAIRIGVKSIRTIWCGP